MKFVEFHRASDGVKIAINSEIVLSPSLKGTTFIEIVGIPFEVKEAYDVVKQKLEASEV
ncbi:MAG: hypothetical protein WBD45_04930 [Terriglobales bacterium]